MIDYLALMARNKPFYVYDHKGAGYRMEWYDGFVVAKSLYAQDDHSKTHVFLFEFREGTLYSKLVVRSGVPFSDYREMHRDSNQQTSDPFIAEAYERYKQFAEDLILNE